MKATAQDAVMRTTYIPVHYYTRFHHTSTHKTFVNYIINMENVFFFSSVIYLFRFFTMGRIYNVEKRVNNIMAATGVCVVYDVSQRVCCALCRNKVILYVVL